MANTEVDYLSEMTLIISIIRSLGRQASLAKYNSKDVVNPKITLMISSMLEKSEKSVIKNTLRRKQPRLIVIYLTVCMPQLRPSEKAPHECDASIYAVSLVERPGQCNRPNAKISTRSVRRFKK